jgi:serine protease
LELEGRKCQQGGGVGVVLRQRSMERLGGKLKVDSDVTIPVAIVNMKDGKALLERVGQSGDLLAADGYMYLDGTSMASPLAAGAAAAVWRSCSSCSADDVDWCLRNTALDLGELGRDSMYGNGLVQMESAHNCLQQDIGCC